MKKKKILFIMLVSGLFVLSATFLPSSALIWAVEDKPMPFELDGTEWEVSMIYVTKKGKKNNSEDKLIFADKKFISERFDKKGYDPTNYSLTLQDDGATRFGTMQIKGKDTSFWKGTIKDGAIDGSVHTQLSGGDSTRTTYFSGDLVTGELKRKVKKPTPPPAPPPPAPAPVVEEVSEGSDKSVFEKAKEAMGGAVEKVQDLVNSNDEESVQEVVEDQVEKTESAE